MYDQLGGSDDQYSIRYLLNALGANCWAIGAIKVACGGTKFNLDSHGYIWMATPGLLILITIPLMDLRDQVGDKARGRSTLPLRFGDCWARYAIVFRIMASSIACTAAWSLGLLASGPTMLIGGLTCYRIVRIRTMAADELSWKLWGPWMVSIFMLPVWKKCSSLPVIT